MSTVSYAYRCQKELFSAVFVQNGYITIPNFKIAGITDIHLKREIKFIITYISELKFDWS